MATPFDYRRAVWLFEYIDRASGVRQSAEQDITAVAKTAMQYAGASVVCQKVADGQYFQARFDSGAKAIDSLATWQQTQQEAQAAGVQLVPWVVPHLATDAAFQAQFGPDLIVDLEDDATQFWADSVARIPVYFAALRAGGVQRIHVSIDPRPIHRTALNVPGWAASVESILPQSYWTDFLTPAMTNLPDIQALLQLNPNVYPVLPYNAAAADLGAFWAACRQLGCRGVHLWRLGVANPTQLRAFAALPLPQPPVDVFAPIRAQFGMLQTELGHLTQQVANLGALIPPAP